LIHHGATLLKTALVNIENEAQQSIAAASFILQLLCSIKLATILQNCFVVQYKRIRKVLKIWHYLALDEATTKNAFIESSLPYQSAKSDTKIKFL
jgi:hypothetical protein